MCTTPFLPLAQAQALALGASAQACEIAEIPHPLGGIAEAEVLLRADAAWPQIRDWLEGARANVS